MSEITKSPGTLETLDFSGSYQVDWTDIDNVKESDDNYATAVCSDNAPYQIKATNFGFNIPLNATVSSVKYEAEVKVSSGTTNLDMSKYPSNSSIDISQITTTEKYISKEITSGYTVSDINSSDFGIGIALFSSYTGTVYVDNIRIIVSYTTPDSSSISNISQISGLQSITL